MLLLLLVLFSLSSSLLLQLKLKLFWVWHLVLDVGQHTHPDLALQKQDRSRFRRGFGNGSGHLGRKKSNSDTRVGVDVFDCGDIHRQSAPWWLRLSLSLSLIICLQLGVCIVFLVILRGDGCGRLSLQLELALVLQYKRRQVRRTRRVGEVVCGSREWSRRDCAGGRLPHFCRHGSGGVLGQWRWRVRCSGRRECRKRPHNGHGKWPLNGR